MGKPFVDLTGQRFGRWFVESRAEDSIYTYSKNGKHYTARYTKWNCVCDCGKKSTVLGSNLTKGKSKSCGCYKSEVFVKNNCGKKHNIRYKSLPNPPTIDVMLKVMLDDEYEKIPENERKERAIESVFYNCWFKFVRDEQATLRRNKHKTCDKCGKKCKTEFHHIRPVSEYGGNEEENILWLCHECHSKIEHRRAAKSG